MLTKYGIYILVFGKCHHNAIYGKANICLPLPLVWDYSKANIENIKKAISSFNRNKTCENLSLDGKVELLNETLLNIFRNYIPNKRIKCDCCHLPWMTENVK